MKHIFRTEAYTVTLLRPSWFRPFINRHGLKLIGMALFAVSQLLTLAKIGGFFFEGFFEFDETLAGFLKGISAISLPLIMVSVFSSIITDERHIRRRLHLYFFFAFAFYILEIVATHAYIYQTALSVFPNAEDLAPFAEELVRVLLAPFAGINVFLDFFVCSSFYYFLIDTPKGLSGLRQKLFRLGSLLPVFYILFGFVLHGLFSLGTLDLDFYAVALLPSKSPSVYLLFFAMVLYRRHRSPDKSGEMFRADSFSVFLALILPLISVADHLLSFLPSAEAFGIGKASTFFLAVPLILCFDYEKPPRNRLAPLIYDPIFYFILYAVLLYYYSEMCDIVIAALASLLE